MQIFSWSVIFLQARMLLRGRGEAVYFRFGEPIPPVKFCWKWKHIRRRRLKPPCACSNRLRSGGAMVAPSGKRHKESAEKPLLTLPCCRVTMNFTPPSPFALHYFVCHRQSSIRQLVRAKNTCVMGVPHLETDRRSMSAGRQSWAGFLICRNQERSNSASESSEALQWLVGCAAQDSALSAHLQERSPFWSRFAHIFVSVRRGDIEPAIASPPNSTTCSLRLPQTNCYCEYDILG